MCTVFVCLIKYYLNMLNSINMRVTTLRITLLLTLFQLHGNCNLQSIIAVTFRQLLFVYLFLVVEIYSDSKNKFCVCREIDRDGDGRISYKDFEFMMKYNIDDVL